MAMDNYEATRTKAPSPLRSAGALQMDHSLGGLRTNRQWSLNDLALHLWVFLVRQSEGPLHRHRQIYDLYFLFAGPEDAGLFSFTADQIRNRVRARLDVGEVSRAFAISHHRHHFGLNCALSLRQERVDNFLLLVVKAGTQFRREINREPFSRQFGRFKITQPLIVSRLKFRHGFVAS